jgi:hypothetical protein
MRDHSAARSLGLNDRVRLLIDRYPNLGEVELAELINLLPLAPLDVGQMITNDRLAAQLAALRENHGDKLKGHVARLVWLSAVALIFGIGADLLAASLRRGELHEKERTRPGVLR